MGYYGTVNYSLNLNMLVIIFEKKNIMARINKNGTCSYCKTTVPKRMNSLTSHLTNKCTERKSRSESADTKHKLILIEDDYGGNYWLLIKARTSLKLQDLDRFLRDIWLECCGHLSDFSENREEISKNERLYNFPDGTVLDYVYDYGTSTELKVKFLEEFFDCNEGNIIVLFRNKSPEFECCECGGKALYSCDYCFSDERDLYCEKCIKLHKCYRKVGKDCLAKIPNSPRMGECGYRGYEEDYVVKYFPKDVIES